MGVTPFEAPLPSPEDDPSFERPFPVDADPAILPSRPDVRRHLTRRGLPLLGLHDRRSPTGAGESSCATSSTDFCNTTTMRGHLHTTASIPRACFWSFPGHVASGRFRIVQSCEQCTSFVAEDCDWPKITESRLLSHWERQSPHSTSLEHPMVTFSRVRCFGEARRVSKGSRSIRRQRSAKNDYLEIDPQSKPWTDRKRTEVLSAVQVRLV